MTGTQMTTEQLRAELEALRESEQQYRRLVELSPDPIVVLQDNRYRLVNPAFTTLFGYTQWDVDNGLSFFELVQEQDKEAVRQRYEDRLAGKQLPQTYHIDLVAKDGRLIPCETSATRITFDNRPADLVLIREITERRQAQGALRDTKERYRLLVDTMNEGVAVRDNDHVVQFVNDKFCQMIGYSREEVIGRQVTAFLDAENASRFEALEDRRARNELGPYELETTRKDGQRVCLQVSPRVLHDSEGNVSGSFAVMTDITERKQAEEELKASDATFKSLLENTTDYILICDDKGLPVVFNSVYARLIEDTLGIEMRPGLQPHKLLPDGAAVAWWDDLHRRVLGGETFRVEYQYDFDPDEIRTFEISYHPIIVDGEVKGFTELSRDITERKRAEEALRGSEQNLRDAQQIAHLGSWDRDLATEEERWSDELFRIFGYEPGEVEASYAAFARLIHPDDREGVLAAIEDALEGRRPYDHEYRLIRPDGAIRILRVQADVFRDYDGEPVRFVGTSLDITERKQAEEALRRSEQNLRDAQQIAHLGSWERDITTGEVRWSDEIFRIFGYEHGEVEATYDAFVSAIHADDRERVFAVIEDALEGKVPYDHEFRLVRHDGTTRIVQVHAEVFRNDIGEPVRLVGTALDITERKQAAEALEQRNRELALLNRTIAATTSTLKVEDVLEMACRELALALDVPSAVAALLDAERATMAVVAEWVDEHQPSARGIVMRAEDNPAFEYVRQHRIPLMIADAQHDPGMAPFHELMKQGGTVSVCLLPLMVQDDVVGMIGLGTRTVREFTKREIELAASVAAAVSQALFNARLFEAESDQRALAEALRDTAAALNSTLDIEDVLERILENVGRVVVHDASDIMLTDGDIAQIAHSRGYTTEQRGGALAGARFTVSKTPTMQQMLQSGKPYIVPDVKASAEWVEHPKTPDWICSYVGAPIRLKDIGVRGFINLNSTKAGFYTASHAQRLQAFADQAAIAIHNAQLYEQVQLHAAQLEELYKVTLAITAELDLEALLQTLVESANALLGVENGGIYLYRPEHDAIEWVVSVGEGHAPTGSMLKHGEGLSGKVWASGKPLAVDNYREWEGRAAIYSDRQWTAVLGVPIQWGDEFLGVINALTNVSNRAFNQHDADLLGLFASQAAIAINNARLYEKIQRHADELEDRVKERTAELNQALERLDAILNSVGDPVFVFDAEGNFQDVNRAFKEQIGAVPEGEQTHITKFLPDRTLSPQMVEEIKKAVDTQYAWRDELIIRPQYGTGFDAAVTITSLHDESGETTAFVGSARDISHLKEVERLREEFMRSVKHKMRTPLAAAYAAVSMLADGDAGPLEGTAQDYAEIIKNETLRLISIINEITDVMDLYAGVVKLSLEPVELSQVVSQVVGEARAQADENTQTIEVKVPDNLPALMADRHQLGRVLRNLIDNALNYAGEGCRIQVSARQHPSRGGSKVSRVQFSVRDNGRGIPERDQAHVFEPFFRVRDPAVLSYTGSGLGLYTVKALVELHGGKVRITSSPDKGSTFTVTWPVAA